MAIHGPSEAQTALVTRNIIPPDFTTVEATSPDMSTSWNNGSPRYHCPPFSQAEMAALKLITSSSIARPSRLDGRWRHALPPPPLLVS
eukprot:12046962-Karenia_brevis.AAC.1